MIINRYDRAELAEALGIDMSVVEGVGVGAAWGRIEPGRATAPDRHDETEVFVIVAGVGHIVVAGQRYEVTAGSVVVLEPFEGHVLENTGAEDLVFFTLYWRDVDRAVEATGRDRFGDRPLFVFSTPPTPNGDLHLGHLSGPYLGADAYVRFQRMNGVEAWHLTGSDDYQSYVHAAARRDGRTSAETAAHFSAEIVGTLDLMDIRPDQYTVTNADPSYRPALQEFFSRLVSSGKVVPEEGPALFDSKTGEYLYEVDVAGGCPTCSEPTSGNICEECGEPNSCVDLVEPTATRTRERPRHGSLTRFMLPLHEFREDVRRHHRAGRVPVRLRELAHRVFQRGSHRIALTHPADWGVPHAQLGPDGQVIWVWPEMAYGFLHGIQALGQGLGRPWRANAPQKEWKIVHFFGYDNSFYHSLLYPMLYRLAHPDWSPDIDYHVNEFYLLEGSKFSTSRRHAIWGKDILGPETVDSVRFFLARTRPEGRRTNFELQAFRHTVEQDLIGYWQRWLQDLGARVEKEFRGTAPDAGVWQPEQSSFLARLENHRRALTDALGPEGFSLNIAAAELHALVADTVRFSREHCAVTGIEGWRSEHRTAVALELAAARLLAACAAPVMPRFAERLATALGGTAPTVWPRTVELLRPGSPIDLARTVFFTEPSTNGVQPA